MNKNQIPNPLLALVADILSVNSHSSIDNLFLRADAPGERPLGNRLEKCTTWLRRCNEERDCNAFDVLGVLVQDIMEREPSHIEMAFFKEPTSKQQITDMLTKFGYKYSLGGKIYKMGEVSSSRTLEEMIRTKDIDSVEREFARAMGALATDPPASLTAACAIIESICKVYIEDNNLQSPKDASIKQLWGTVAKDLNLDPARIEDDDIKRILSGMFSVVDGIGALRTHAGSAHGRGKTSYKILPRHARLAVHAAHTLAAYILESWDDRASQ